MTKKKIKIRNTVKLKTYSIISDVIERGVAIGWRFAHKHTDTPHEDLSIEFITNAIMGELNEIFDYGDGLDE